MFAGLLPALSFLGITCLFIFTVALLSETGISVSPIVVFIVFLLFFFLFNYLIQRGNNWKRDDVSSTHLLFLCSIFPTYAWNIGNKMQLGRVMCLSIKLRKGTLPEGALPSREEGCRGGIGSQENIPLENHLWIVRQQSAPTSQGSVVAKSVTLKPGCWVWSLALPPTSGFHLIPLKLRLSKLHNGNNSTYSVTLSGRSGELIHVIHLCPIHIARTVC